EGDLRGEICIAISCDPAVVLNGMRNPSFTDPDPRGWPSSVTCTCGPTSRKMLSAMISPDTGSGAGGGTSCAPSSISPQCRHLIALAWIVSAQSGQSLVCGSGAASAESGALGWRLLQQSAQKYRPCASLKRRCWETSIPQTRQTLDRAVGWVPIGI